VLVTRHKNMQIFFRGLHLGFLGVLGVLAARSGLCIS